LTGQHVNSVSKKVATKPRKRRTSTDTKSTASIPKPSSTKSLSTTSSWTKPISGHSTTAADNNDDSPKSRSSSSKTKKKVTEIPQQGKAIIKKKKKKKIPKAKTIPTFASQYGDEMASIADNKSKHKDKSKDEYNNTTAMDQSGHRSLDTKSFAMESVQSGKSKDSLNDSLQNSTSQNKQILLEFELPDQQGTGLQLSVDLETVGDMSSIESWPSIESDDSYDTKMNKMMQRWMDLNGDFDAFPPEEEEETSEKGPDLDDNVLDHIVLASPSMKEALDTFEKLAGVRPVMMGPLEGLGVQTARVGMDKGRYIEIIAPDDKNPGPLAKDFKSLPAGRLIPYQYAIRATEISRLIEGYVYDVLGWDPDHICMVQTLPDGTPRQWDLLTMYGHNIGGAAPIYVRYPDSSEHPTATLEPTITLKKFTVQADRDHRVHKLITDVGGIDIEYAQTPALVLSFDTPKGGLALSANYPAGLVFPGYNNADSKKSKTKKKSSRKSQ